MKKLRTQALLVILLSFSVTACHKSEMMPSGPKISSHTRFMFGETSTFSILNAGDSPVTVDFGDGEQASGNCSQMFNHIYQVPGDYYFTAQVNGENLEKQIRVYELRALSTVMPELLDPDYKRIWVMSHRAHSTDKSIPENSISAVKECIRLGVDFIETDPQLTADGVVVICHDQTIDRTTDGEGDITEMNLEEIRKYHLLDREGHVTSETIPTLEEFLKAARGKIYVNLDYSGRTASTSDVLSIVQKLDMMQCVTLYCGSELKVKECFAMRPDTQVFPWATAYGPAVGKGNYFVQYNESTPEAGALRNGMVCSVNMKSLENPSQSEHDGSAFKLDEAEVEKVMVDFPTLRLLHTDVPAELIKYLENKGLR